MPREGDILSAALPMCAPYSAIQSYKYRIKLTPGAQRKGKAARQVRSALLHSAVLLLSGKQEKQLLLQHSIAIQSHITHQAS